MEVIAPMMATDDWPCVPTGKRWQRVDVHSAAGDIASSGASFVPMVEAAYLWIYE